MDKIVASVELENTTDRDNASEGAHNESSISWDAGMSRWRYARELLLSGAPERTANGACRKFFESTNSGHCADKGESSCPSIK